jgi:hypothetical protein
MEQTPEEKKLNPQITDVDIGVRDLRKVKLYPLALGDQLELSDLIKEVLEAFFKTEDGSEESLSLFIAFAFNLIKENMTKILGLIALDEANSKKLLKEITNAQLDEIAQVVYEKNFAVLKNLKGLFGKITTKIPKA